MIKSIAFDVDGTLTDEFQLTHQAFLAYYKKIFGKDYTGKVDVEKYQLNERYPDITDTDFMHDFENWHWSTYLRTHPFLPDVKELFEKLKASGVEIHVITARGSHYQPWQNVTPEISEELTKKRFEDAGIPVDHFHIGVDEKLSIMRGNNIDIIVEDSPSQAEKISEEFPVLLRPTTYNKYCRGKNIWRFDTFKHIPFLNNVNYALEHVDNWKEEYVLEKSVNENTVDMDYITDDEKVIFNVDSIERTNLTFVLSLGNEFRQTRLTDQMVHENPDLIPLRLSLLNDPSLPYISKKGRYNEGDQLVLQAIRKCNKKNIDLSSDANSRDVYLMKVAIIESLLKYIKAHQNKKFIMDGIEIFLLDREKLSPYAKYPICICGINDRDRSVIRRCVRKKDYNPWIILEDLTEVSTQLRKWRIISGTAKNELPTYINRQTTTSDGVDIVRLLPGEKPYHPEVFDRILCRNTYLVGDPHISSKDPEKTKRIINSINKTVSRNEHLIILGDLDGKKGTGSVEITTKFIKAINTKNIYLIVGNNDPYTIETYAKIGFKAITDIAVFQESSNTKVYLTHCPYPVTGDEINIHGHIHGSKCYWNMDWKNHYDVWDEDFVPITIGKCLDIIENNQYHARSENHSVY